MSGRASCVFALLPLLLASAVAAADVKVTAGGVDFLVPERGALKTLDGKRQRQVFGLNIRVGGRNGIASAWPDWRDAKMEVVEDTAKRCVVRCESSMSIRESGADAKPEAWDAGKFFVDYVFVV